MPIERVTRKLISEEFKRIRAIQTAIFIVDKDYKITEHNLDATGSDWILPGDDYIESTCASCKNEGRKFLENVFMTRIIQHFFCKSSDGEPEHRTGYQ